MKNILSLGVLASALVVGLGFSGNATAAFQSCVGTNPAYDITGKVTPSKNCTILAPVGGAENDDVGGGNSNFANFTVNQEAFFGQSDWLFDGKWNSGNGGFTDTSGLFNFTGGAQSGTFTRTATPLPTGAGTVMFVFKDGGDTNLVGYLLNLTALGSGTGTYSSPFVEPPFAFPGTGPRAVSHISVYYREGSTPPDDNPTPEPMSLALVGLGLAGVWVARRRRTA